MTNKDLDISLIKHTLSGNHNAFKDIVIRYQQKVENIMARDIPDHQIVLDLSQEVFFKAYRALNKFQGNSAFYTWLYRIAVNTKKNYLKSISRKPIESNIETNIISKEAFPNEYQLNEYNSPENITSCNEVGEIIIFAINSLPYELKQSILLRELEGLSYNDIAKNMNCPIGTVRSRIFRARSILNERIENMLNNTK